MMFFTDISNLELQYFKGLTVPNFTIKLSDIRHKTSGTYDNKLFKIEDITDSIFRIVPLFNVETINGSNPNDIIIDDLCIIAHLEESETYFTFIGDSTDETIQDYESYTSYFGIGDSLNENQFNSIVSLLRHSILHEDSIRINDSVDGLYGKYEFDIDDCTFLDTGILITDETISAEPKVKLTNNVFRWSTYTLKLNVIHYTGVNILDDISPSDLKVVETLEVELTPNEWVDIPVSSLEQNYIISFDAVTEISHDKPEIHKLTGLTLNANPTTTQTGGYSDITAQLIDIDGREYNITDGAGKTIHFFEVITPTFNITATKDTIQSDDTTDINCTVIDADGSKLKNSKVYFYKKVEE